MFLPMINFRDFAFIDIVVMNYLFFKEESFCFKLYIAVSYGVSNIENLKHKLQRHYLYQLDIWKLETQHNSAYENRCRVCAKSCAKSCAIFLAQIGECVEKASEKRETKRQMLTLLTEDFLSFKQVIKQLNLSKRTAYRYLEEMKNAGVITGNSWMGFTKKSCAKNDQAPSEGGGTNYLKNIYSRTIVRPLLRYHGIEFLIRLSYETKHKRRVVKYKGSTIIFKGKTISIYSRENQFEGYSVSEIEQNMLDFFWKHYFPLVEARYNIPFLKEGKTNIEIVNGHIEEYDSETGMWMKKNDMKRYKCRGRDGKVWLEYDESFNGSNMEVKHPELHTDDAKMLFDKFHNEIRDGYPSPKEQMEFAIKSNNSLRDAIKELNEKVDKVTNKGAFDEFK